MSILVDIEVKEKIIEMYKALSRLHGKFQIPNSPKDLIPICMELKKEIMQLRNSVYLMMAYTSAMEKRGLVRDEHGEVSFKNIILAELEGRTIQVEKEITEAKKEKSSIITATQMPEQRNGR